MELTKEEREIVSYRIRGYRDIPISILLGISDKAARQRYYRLRKKLGITKYRAPGENLLAILIIRNLITLEDITRMYNEGRY